MSQHSKPNDLAQLMRSGMRRLVSGVSVVSSRDGHGRAYAMTVSSVTSVSDTPPSLLLCVNQNTQIAPVLIDGQPLVINVLSQGHQDVSITCSTGEQCQQRLETGDWFDDGVQIPYLKDAEARFECVVDVVYPFGTHNIVVATIAGVEVSSDGPNPLVYANAGYHALSTTSE